MSGSSRADQFPTLNGSPALRISAIRLIRTHRPSTLLSIQLNYILDFWGQYRSATEAARANCLLPILARNIVETTLISSVAAQYFLLRQFDSQLEFAHRSLEADNQILKINTIKYKGGESAITDLYQAQLLVQQAEAQVITLQQSIPQTENQISILLGRNPGPVNRGLRLSISPIWLRFPRDCLPHCSSDVLMSDRRSRSWWPRMQTLE